MNYANLGHVLKLPIQDVALYEFVFLIHKKKMQVALEKGCGGDNHEESVALLKVPASYPLSGNCEITNMVT